MQAQGDTRWLDVCAHQDTEPYLCGPNIGPWDVCFGDRRVLRCVCVCMCVKGEQTTTENHGMHQRYPQDQGVGDKEHVHRGGIHTPSAHTHPTHPPTHHTHTRAHSHTHSRAQTHMRTHAKSRQPHLTYHWNKHESHMHTRCCWWECTRGVEQIEAGITLSQKHTTESGTKQCRRADGEPWKVCGAEREHVSQPWSEGAQCVCMRAPPSTAPTNTNPQVIATSTQQPTNATLPMCPSTSPAK